MINTASIEKLLRPGLNSVFGNYAQWPSQWSEWFKESKSEMAYEQDVEMKFLGLAEFMPEGSPTAMGSMGQRTVTTYQHKYVSLGFQITRQALADNLYKDKFPMMAQALKESMAQTKELIAASIFNQGFNAAFPIGDGKPFFATDHPIDNGVVANRPTVNVDLSEAS
jgi:phage major head subunit gpT-like protein